MTQNNLLRASILKKGCTNPVGVIRSSFEFPRYRYLLLFQLDRQLLNV